VFEHRVTYAQPVYRSSGIISFSHTELKHLLVGGLLTLAIGLSMPLWWGAGFYASPLPLIVLAFLFAVSFLSHELAHKVAAQQYGLWAEFRITPYGALITLLSTISPFKIISPGTVVVAGVADKGIIGRTAVVGPVTNIVFALVFFFITQLVQVTGVMGYALMYTVMINAFIALFNLLPFGILDGYKVFEWNKIIWLIVFIPSIVLTVYGATSFSFF
jgi:Zn-dependent protease